MTIALLYYRMIKMVKLVIPNGSQVPGPGYSPADTVDGVLKWFLIQLNYSFKKIVGAFNALNLVNKRL